MDDLFKKRTIIFFIFLYTISSQSILSSDQDATTQSNLSDDDELEYWPKYMDDLPANFFYFDLNDPHYLDHCFYDDEDEHNKDLAKLYEAISEKSAVDKATSEKIVRGSFSQTTEIDTQSIDSNSSSGKKVKTAKNVQFAPIDQVAPTDQVAYAINAIEPTSTNAAKQSFIVRSHSPVNYNEMNPKTRTKILSIFSLAQLHKMTENDFGLEPSKKK